MTSTVGNASGLRRFDSLRSWNGAAVGPERPEQGGWGRHGDKKNGVETEVSPPFLKLSRIVHVFCKTDIQVDPVIPTPSGVGDNPTD